MWSAWLLPISILSSVTSTSYPYGGALPSIERLDSHLQQINNRTQQLRDVEFSIEEVLLLNRHFLDYLAAIDDEIAQQLPDPQCTIALRKLSEAYLNRERHGLEWFDSWGKVPSGLYGVNGHAVGNVDQCRRFSWEHIRGQHCTFIAAFPSDMEVFVSGLCLPHFCDPDFVHGLYGDHLSTQGVVMVPFVEQEMMCIRDEEIKYDGAMITAIVFSAIFAGLLLCSTLYEVVQLALKRDVKPLYSSFSLLRNIRSILQLVPRSRSEDKKSSMIECAHGIRAISMIWIIVLHVHDTMDLVLWENAQTLSKYFGGFTPSLLYFSGMLAVDTFFVLSGMLVAMSMLRELDKNGKINPLMLYLHRYIRITAPFAALILFMVSFATYMGEGILWKPVLFGLKGACVQNWWAALLHVQNYVDSGNMCLPWSWYLSVDMQLYILAPALIYPLWRYGKRVLIVIAGLAVLSMGCVLASFLVNEFRINSNLDPRKSSLTYHPTHARMAVWLWGLAFGYLLHKTKDTGVNLPKRYWTAGWTICFVLLGLIIFGNYTMSTTDPQDFSHVVDAFYEPLSRSVFGFCVLWIILACVNGKGGLIDDFLGAPMWQPLSKLSFTMYLLHILLLLMASVVSSKTSVHFSVIDVFYRIWGAIGLTTGVGLLWSAIFEVPFMTLDKLLLKT